MKHKVRGRDGTIRDVDDDYVLRDGEARVVEMPLMDSRRAIIHDGHGHPAGQRPGFLYSDENEHAERARVDAYEDYAKTIAERWRLGPGQRSSPARSEPQSFESPEAALAAAYEKYSRDIQERWRR